MSYYFSRLPFAAYWRPIFQVPLIQWHPTRPEIRGSQLTISTAIGSVIKMKLRKWISPGPVVVVLRNIKIHVRGSYRAWHLSLPRGPRASKTASYVYGFRQKCLLSSVWADWNKGKFEGLFKEKYFLIHWILYYYMVLTVQHNVKCC